MPEEKPKNIQEVIEKIKKPDFTYSQLKPEEFAPAPDKQGKEGGIAYIIAKQTEMKITQLRKLFAEIKQIERELKGRKEEGNLEGIYPRLWLLHPELAYARGRGLIDEKFYELMILSLSRDKLGTVKDFFRFSEFITAIFAYKKYVGEKKIHKGRSQDV